MTVGKYDFWTEEQPSKSLPGGFSLKWGGRAGALFSMAQRNTKPGKKFYVCIRSSPSLQRAQAQLKQQSLWINPADGLNY